MFSEVDNVDYLYNFCDHDAISVCEFVARYVENSDDLELVKVFANQRYPRTRQ